MNVEIGAEVALFPEKEYISGIFVAVRLSVSYKVVLSSRVQEGPMKKIVEGKILLVSIIEYEVRSPKFIWAPYGQLSFYYRIYVCMVVSASCRKSLLLPGISFPCKKRI
jgi:hypothetical protein